MRSSSFQKSVTSGTLIPYLILLCVVLYWLARYLFHPINEPSTAVVSLFWEQFQESVPNHLISRALNVLLLGIVLYLLMEITLHFSLIRTRTTAHLICFILFTSSLFSVQGMQVGNLCAIFTLLAVVALFSMYQNKENEGRLFSVFFMLSVGSLFYYKLLYLCPLFVIGSYFMQLGSMKCFFAGLLGLLTPYWLLFGYAFWIDELSLFEQVVEQFTSLSPLSLPAFRPVQVIVFVLFSFLLITSIGHYYYTIYQDKIRTRVYLNFLAAIALYVYLLIFLFPVDYITWLSIDLVLGSLFMGHFFALKMSEVVNYILVASFIILIGILILNMWIY